MAHEHIQNKYELKHWFIAYIDNNCQIFSDIKVNGAIHST
jgi:hypothetical protein